MLVHRRTFTGTGTGTGFLLPTRIFLIHSIILFTPLPPGCVLRGIGVKTGPIPWVLRGVQCVSGSAKRFRPTDVVRVPASIVKQGPRPVKFVFVLFCHVFHASFLSLFNPHLLAQELYQDAVFVNQGCSNQRNCRNGRCLQESERYNCTALMSDEKGYHKRDKPA